MRVSQSIIHQYIRGEIMMKYKIIFVCALAGLCLCACGTKGDKDKKVNAENTDNVKEKEQDTSKEITPGESDLLFVNSIEELWKDSEYVVNATVKKRTEIGDEETGEEIEYELKINEWLKGSGESDEIKLKTWNNAKNRYLDVYYYDFNADGTYVFFLKFSEQEGCYRIACETAGLIEVEEDNRVNVQENDQIFKDCKTYEEVIKIIKTQQ